MSVARIDNNESDSYSSDEEDQSVRLYVVVLLSLLANISNAEWLKRKIVASGVRPRDVPMAFGMFIFVKWSLYMAGLGLCVRYHPLRRLANQGLPKRLLGSLRQKYPNRYQKIERKTFETAESISKSPYFRPLPIWLRVDPKNFVYSLVRSQFSHYHRTYNTPHPGREPLSYKICFQYTPHDYLLYFQEFKIKCTFVELLTSFIYGD